jgi:hypothetical protein
VAGGTEASAERCQRGLSGAQGREAAHICVMPRASGASTMRGGCGDDGIIRLRE